MKDLAFGPVPSRRLGRSLGINNIPPKECSYSCVYCQVGKTYNTTIKRKAFCKQEDLLEVVRKKVEAATAANKKIDFLTFVPDGEPTLDLNISKEISFLKQIGLPIAVITNASLLWRDDVREDLEKVDFVSLKIDTVSEDLWRKVNRPNKSLRLNTVLEGIRDFAKEFQGEFVSETMLLRSIDYEGEFERIVEFLTELKKLKKAYIAIPTRPPTEKWVKSAKEEVINFAVQTFSSKLGANRVECLVGYEGNAFASTGDFVEDILSITAVHPMREEAIRTLLKKTNLDWQVVEKLLCVNKLVQLEYEGKNYYMRKLPNQ